MIQHFNTQAERIAFVKGKFEEIVPVKSKKRTKKVEDNDGVQTEQSGADSDSDK